MQLAHVSTKVLITGRSGSGKTTYFQRYLQGLPAGVKRWIFDAEGELSIRLGVRAVSSPDEISVAAQAGDWLVYDPAPMFPGRIPDAFRFFCSWAWHAAARMPGRKVFAVDELQRFTTTATIAPEAALVLETGRRYGLDLVAAAQQPNLIHNRFRNQMTELAVFATTDPRAQEAIAAWGVDPQAAARLQDGEFVAVNLRSRRQVRGRVF